MAGALFFTAKYDFVVRNVSSTWSILDSLDQTPKKKKNLKVEHVWVKSSALKYSNYSQLLNYCFCPDLNWTRWRWCVVYMIFNWVTGQVGDCLILFSTCIIYHISFLVFILYVYLSGLWKCVFFWGWFCLYLSVLMYLGFHHIAF